ncbi:SdiA-regulated domain-containing protein [Gramella jeungdoensis]|uniref:SdiA-regulated domain-containing protein n=1 Tax=Gramella jeungdoensis TaxID=708091 RepID=A0ABT0Z375_9FLAO|nr:SdiA-regulated domain-containing protein [Gramella jeungdoensis]MCM8570169.1 SdiA-regulated domain-containing protein [Gramella jeungdoensis]
MTKWAVGIVITVLILAGAIYAIYEEYDYDFEDAEKSYETVRKWDLPTELQEVSGMEWAGNEEIACIQDEDGIIFIYDLKSSKIIKRYKFGGPGDYEAITRLDDNYWVAESNGRLVRVEDINGQEENSEDIQLKFEYRNNIEGAAASGSGDLWISVKDRNLDNQGDYKGIYSFDPVTGVLDMEPVLKVNYDDPEFDVFNTSNPRKLIRPSDICFHPTTRDLYILDAEFQKILVVNRDTGKIKRIHLLDPSEFPQPEGICFSPSGRLFVSNEGNLGTPSIIEIKLL